MTVQDRPLTPTKEEAATALASLATEDSGGLEIAEALQKLASAFGLNQVSCLFSLLNLSLHFSPSFVLVYFNIELCTQIDYLNIHIQLVIM